MVDGLLKKQIKNKGFVQYTGDGKRVQMVPILMRQLDMYNLVDDAQKDLESDASFDCNKEYYITISMEKWKKWFGDSS